MVTGLVSCYQIIPYSASNAAPKQIPISHCPLGELFGCGPGLHPFTSLTRSVDQSGQMRCRWGMPYRRRAAILTDVYFDVMTQTPMGQYSYMAFRKFTEGN